MHSNYSDGGHSAVLCTLPLTGSLNSVYAVRYRFAQIPPFGRGFAYAPAVVRN